MLNLELGMCLGAKKLAEAFSGKRLVRDTRIVYSALASRLTRVLKYQRACACLCVDKPQISMLGGWYARILVSDAKISRISAAVEQK